MDSTSSHGGAGSAFPAWAAFTQELQQLGDKIVARLPPRLRDDPQVRQEAGRLLLEGIAPRVIEAISSDVDHPTFLPSLNATMNIFQPNADTIYFNTDLSDQGAYRLRGTRGSVRMLRMAQFRALTGEVKFGSYKKGSNPLQALNHHNFDDLQLDDQGRFNVILSPKRPDGYNGDWWELKPGVGYVVVRQVSSDWANEQDARLAIERLDVPVQRPRPSAADLEARLRRIATAVGNTALSFVTHVDDMRNEGYINSLKIMQTPGALQGQFYYEGPFEIAPDEALIVEAKVPNTCGYWSTILTNDLYETIDWVNNQSSLNDAQARVDSDGVVRFVLSVKDPGVPNWLDTTGHLTGVVQGRWTECDSQPIPTMTKVALGDVRSKLPADTPVVTPEQREAVVRERRMHFQLRPVW